ncbi:TPA: hypothetical protein ACG0MZ_005051 [Citrobacter farmeri]
MPIKIRVMPDCIVITTQNTRELYGCAEGLPNCKHPVNSATVAGLAGRRAGRVVAAAGVHLRRHRRLTESPRCPH